jgi:integrase
VRTTSQDPDLNLLLVRFHLESGARRDGALALRVRDLDPRRGTMWLREKFGSEREQPRLAVPGAGVDRIVSVSGGWADVGCHGHGGAGSFVGVGRDHRPPRSICTQLISPVKRLVWRYRARAHDPGRPGLTAQTRREEHHR